MTSLQIAMLNKIARNDFTNVNGDEPKTLNDIGWIWASEIIVTAQDKGVYTSLVNANMVEHNGESGLNACITLTIKGFEAYKASN